MVSAGQVLLMHKKGNDFDLDAALEIGVKKVAGHMKAEADGSPTPKKGARIKEGQKEHGRVEEGGAGKPKRTQKAVKKDEDDEAQDAASPKATKRARPRKEEDGDSGDEGSPSKKKSKKNTAVCAENAELAECVFELGGHCFKEGDRMKGSALMRVYTALMEHPEVIASGKQAGQIKYIGKSSVLKIDEFRATGEMEALNTFRAQKNQASRSEGLMMEHSRSRWLPWGCQCRLWFMPLRECLGEGLSGCVHEFVAWVCLGVYRQLERLHVEARVSRSQVRLRGSRPLAGKHQHDIGESDQCRRQRAPRRCFQSPAPKVYFQYYCKLVGFCSPCDAVTSLGGSRLSRYQPGRAACFNAGQASTAPGYFDALGEDLADWFNVNNLRSRSKSVRIRWILLPPDTGSEGPPEPRRAHVSAAGLSDI